MVKNDKVMDQNSIHQARESGRKLYAERAKIYEKEPHGRSIALNEAKNICQDNFTGILRKECKNGATMEYNDHGNRLAMESYRKAGKNPPSYFLNYKEPVKLD
jgi:hypothetical protein